MNSNMWPRPSATAKPTRHPMALSSPEPGGSAAASRRTSSLSSGSTWPKGETSCSSGLRPTGGIAAKAPPARTAASRCSTAASRSLQAGMVAGISGSGSGSLRTATQLRTSRPATPPPGSAERPCTTQSCHSRPLRKARTGSRLSSVALLPRPTCRSAMASAAASPAGLRELHRACRAAGQGSRSLPTGRPSRSSWRQCSGGMRRPVPGARDAAAALLAARAACSKLQPCSLGRAKRERAICTRPPWADSPLQVSRPAGPLALNSCRTHF
mmetsp:Transcript_71197/g.230475  ORF Transcript_71197/g.230475 Transcript_71197/m.230475 type:complete len:270 (-) Transcript_71197:171-980(-)